MECSKNDPQNFAKFNQIPDNKQINRIFLRSVCLALVLVLLLHLDESCFLFLSLLDLAWSGVRRTHAWCAGHVWEIFLPHRRRFKPATVVFFYKTTNVIHTLVDKRTQNKPVGELFSQTTNFNKIFEKEKNNRTYRRYAVFIDRTKKVHIPRERAFFPLIDCKV